MKKEALMEIASHIRQNAYAPVTGYQVGAALLAKSGTVYVGTNIEEPTIPNLSNCAERVAIQNAMAHGEREFEAIAIVGGRQTKDDTVTPCGVCLQYILDMCDNIEIITYIEGKLVGNRVKDFLTVPFTLEKGE